MEDKATKGKAAFLPTTSITSPRVSDNDQLTGPNIAINVAIDWDTDLPSQTNTAYMIKYQLYSRVGSPVATTTLLAEDFANVTVGETTSTKTLSVTGDYTHVLVAVSLVEILPLTQGQANNPFITHAIDSEGAFTISSTLPTPPPSPTV